MARLLPCSYCGKYALWPPSPGHPDGTPALIGTIHGPFVDVHCFRCGGKARNPGVSTGGRVLPRTTRLQAADINRLPELTYEELVRLGFKELATQDLEGYGLTQKQAVDCFRNGLGVQDLESLEREA